MFVPSGSFLTWVGTFESWSFDTISLDDAIVQISAYLKNNYHLIVTGYDSTLAGDSGAGTVTLSLQTNMDRGDNGPDDGVSDIKSNVDDAWARISTYGATAPNLTGSSCSINTIAPTNGGSGPDYSFSFRNLLPTWLGGEPVTPEQQAQYTKQGQAQIQAVSTNAKAGYGANTVSATTASDAAATQGAAYSADQAKLAADQNAAAASSDKWLLYGLVAAAAVVVAVVAFPYVRLASER